VIKIDELRFDPDNKVKLDEDLWGFLRDAERFFANKDRRKTVLNPQLATKM